METQHRTQLIDKLPQLQNVIKRDPSGYREEFMVQYRHFESEYSLFHCQPCDVNSERLSHFASIVSFLCHVASCYPEKMVDFPIKMVQLIQEYGRLMHSELRKSLVQSIILLHNRDLLSSMDIFPVFFGLLDCNDKRLREMMYAHLISDLEHYYKAKKHHGMPQRKRMSGEEKQIRIKRVQSFLYEQIMKTCEKEGNNGEEGVVKEMCCKYALEMLVIMYRKKYWVSAKSVNMLAMAACSSTRIKIVVRAMQFFLGIEQDLWQDEENAKVKMTEQEKVDYHLHSRKTKKRHRQTKSALIKNRKARARVADEKLCQPIFPALQMINDPQGVVEKQFGMMKRTNERFEVKLIMMDFISRVIGTHQIVFLPFYSMLQKYLNSHQKNITQILAYLVQSCHARIPPQELMSVVKTICNNFITERCDSLVISVGMNALRQLFIRVPLLLEISDMDTLVEDLIMYNKTKDKSVVIASRSVLNTIRELHPVLLRKKHRGKFYNEAQRPQEYGALTASTGVDGVELLQQAETEGRFDDDNEADAWEVASNSSSSSDDEDGWTDLPDDEEMNEDTISIPSSPESNNDESLHNQTPNEENPDEQAPIALDRQRILTPRDFERIEMLKAEEREKQKDPKMRGKNKVQFASTPVNDGKVNPEDLEGYAKRQRKTQEERLLSVLKGREEHIHRKSGGGTTNTEKNRKKHYLMLRKSKAVQSKMRLSTRQVQHKKNKVIKKELKHDRKKRRRL